MRKFFMLFTMAMAIQAGPAAAVPMPHAVVADPPRDVRYPAHNEQLLIPSQSLGMNALLFAASGKAPHPTVILMHGLPGNERNLDLAQAIRRTGWDVLTFTYRGAWGSPGDFSITNAMDDTQAALDFARSAEGAKLGIDPRHIVLAGHSVGGATASITAAGARGLDGLILLDPLNIAATARESKRSDLVANFDDFGNSLHGTTPEIVTDEIFAKGAQWDLAAAAPRLRTTPILTITALHGLAMQNRATTMALRRAGNHRVTAMEMDTDHAFSDHRVAVEAAVVRWLQALPVRR